MKRVKEWLKVSPKEVMYWNLTGSLVAGTFACLGIIFATNSTKSFDERSYWATLTLILIVLFRWFFTDYKEIKTKIKSKKEGK